MSKDLQANWSMDGDTFKVLVNDEELCPKVGDGLIRRRFEVA